MSNRTVAWLLRQIDQAYERKAWHGPNLRGALRGVTAEQAAWRPAPGRHNIWEVAVHAAYWKYIVGRRLDPAACPAFPLAGSDWLERPAELSEKAWRADLAVLAEVHRQMRGVIAGLGEIDLGARPASGTSSIGDLLTGAAFHDVYHAGQIQLLKRLWKAARRPDAAATP